MGTSENYRRELAGRLLAHERRFSDELKKLEGQRTEEERDDRVKRDLRQHAEHLHVAALIRSELDALQSRRDTAGDADERRMLEAEISCLHTLKANLAMRGRPLPPARGPESGIAMPAVPPRGPLPKQGGTEAPLDP